MSLSTKIYVVWALVTLAMFPFWSGAVIKWNWKDCWQGVYFGKDGIYVCLIPFLVIFFPKNGEPQ